MNNFINEFVKFCQTYWREIVDVSVLIISVIICLIRKRPCINKMDEIKEDVLQVLPIFIKGIEKPGNGESKKNQVIELCKNFVKKKFKIDCPQDVMDLVENQIEVILSTPQKKGN